MKSDPRASVPLTDEQSELVRQNIRLAYRFAYRFAKRMPQRVEVDDLISAAMDGLVRAVQTYDPKRAELSTYANVWMRNRCIDAMHNMRSDAILTCLPRDHLRSGHLFLVDACIYEEEKINALHRLSPEDRDQVAKIEYARELVAMLPRKYAKVVQMRLAGWSNKEIGKKIRSSEAVVSWLYRTALQMMRDAENGGCRGKA